MLEAILIAGPTASGKSTAALALAERLGGTIINADSMQVYRELQVLTARPNTAEMEIAPHRLYGTVAGRDAYSVGRWVGDAAAAIEDARKRGQVPILVGGTGLYFMAMLQGLSPVPEIPGDIRRHWRERAAAGADLHAALSARDPVMAARLSPKDTQRLVRALEVIDATDTSLADWQATAGTPVLHDEDVLKILVAPEREAIYAAIEGRFEHMLQGGALAEVEALAELELNPGLPVMRAFGVSELTSYLSGTISLEEAATKAKTASRRYAKRQMTWARRFMADWTWVPSGEAAAASVQSG